jgi:hypothetical protein
MLANAVTLRYVRELVPLVTATLGLGLTIDMYRPAAGARGPAGVRSGFPHRLRENPTRTGVVGPISAPGDALSLDSGARRGG